jgi:DNA-directed RNA polymerase specialized sigma24 family protein
MHGTEAYLRSKHQADECICREETPEVVAVLSRSLPSVCRRAFRPRGEATSSDDAIEKALLSAYKHLGQSKGPAQMSIWLTAIALLILGPDCAEVPPPKV